MSDKPETKWTPGPWHAEQQDDDEGQFVIRDIGDEAIARVMNEYVDHDMAVAEFNGPYGKQMEANAHLTAAAPELL